MIGLLKDILTMIGVPGKIVAGILSISLIVTATLVIDHAVVKRENALQSSVNYIPVSQKKDSLILAKVIEMGSYNKAMYDSIRSNFNTLNRNFKALKIVNEQKFDLIINNNSNLNSSLKKSFENLDNNFNFLLQTIGSSQKKNPIPLWCQNESIKL